MKDCNHLMVKPGTSGRIESNSGETYVAWTGNVPCAWDFSVIFV